MLPSSVTAVPGPYRVKVTPWCKDIMESFDDLEVQTTVLCMASRIGKTETMLNLIGQAIDEDPSNILVCYPTIDAVKNFFAESVQPMFQASRCFRGKISSQARKDGKNTQLKKRFPGGVLRGIGANVASAFRGVQARRVIGDEIDAMEMGKEGDPVDLLFKRAENYANAQQVLGSTPTIAGLSRIWTWLERSDFRKWHVPSPYGDHWHVLDWANVKWEPGQPETAYYQDPVTGDRWTDEQRIQAIEQGEWRATLPFAGIRGYWADGLISLFPPKKGFANKLHQFAAEFLQAKTKGHEAQQVWHNTFRALPWEEETEKVEWELVAARAESYEVETLPDRVLLLTAAADVQEDRIEIEWVGWGQDFESWGLKYLVITGDTKRPETWERFEDEMRRTWQHPIDGEMKLTRGFCDEGFRPDMVRRACVRLLAQGVNVYPCKGLGRTGVLEPELVSYKPNKSQKGLKAPTWNIGSSRAKRTIYNHLLANPPGPNTMHFPEGNGYDERYYQMLTAERVATRYSYGKPYKVFECPSGARNEALDIRCYGYAAAYSLNPQWDVLYSKRTKRSEKADTKPETSKELILTKVGPDVKETSMETKTRRPHHRRGGGFVNRW